MGIPRRDRKMKAMQYPNGSSGYQWKRGRLITCNLSCVIILSRDGLRKLRQGGFGGFPHAWQSSLFPVFPQAVLLAAPQASEPSVPERAAAPGAAGDGAASCQDGMEPSRALPAPGTLGIHPRIPCLQPEVPVVFLCSHQSQVDGLLLSFILLSHGIGLPRVAVGAWTSPRLR